jgi:Predicted P-loop ATPase
MWSDNETKEDLLGFKVHADLIKGVVLDKELSPVIMGVFGDWGSGKSSVLKIIQNDLEKEENKICCLYFNGWLFEGYDDAKAALLESILEMLADNENFAPSVKKKAQKLIKSVNWMRAVRLGFKNIGLPVLAAYLTSGTSLIGTVSNKLQSWINDAKANPEGLVKKLQSKGSEDIIDELIKSNQEDPEIGIKQFRKSFKELLDETGLEALVILIDDLDRCEPERVLENLEAIKLFLNVENTAFIIGADQRLVQQAVKHKYKDDDRLVKEYLEKLIQVPYHLPKLSDSEVETYMALLFCKRELEKTHFQQILNNFYTFRESDRYSVFSYSRIKHCLDTIPLELSTKLDERLRMVHNIAPLITKGLEGNPRQIKRYLNAFILRKKLSEVAKLSDFKDDILTKLMILEYTEESLFKQLYQWQAIQDGFPTQMENLEKICRGENIEEAIVKEVNENWSKDKIIKWIKLEPALSKIDLRDYFWITRDKLSESMSGSLLVPPIVKKVIQELYEQSPSQSIIKKKVVKNIVGVFGELEMKSFYEVLKTRTIKEPSEKHHYDIYYALVKNGAPNGSVKYAEVLTINMKSAPPATALQLIELAKDHQNISEVVNQIVESSSTLGKAIKLKNKKVK